MQKPSAFLFDLNGTMIDDMQYHIRAWHDILNSLGANISMERMKEECYGKNEELLDRMFPGRFSDKEKSRMSMEKETAYQNVFRPHLKLINGLNELMERASKKGISMAIGSAAIMYNIDFVLDGLNIRNYFDAIVTADDVTRSKPDPETWLKCANAVGLSAGDCLVFEDSPKGAESALNAGMKCVIVTSLHGEEEFDNYKNVIRFISDFSEIFIADFLNPA